MRRLLWALVLGVGSITGWTDGAQAQASTGSVAGSVLCDDGDVPARGAKVVLTPLADLFPKQAGAAPDGAEAMETTTDFSGGYEFLAVAPGTYLVAANMDGYSDDLALTRTLLPRFTPDEQKLLLGSFPQVTVHTSGSLRQDLVLRRAGAVTGQVTVDVGGTVAPGSPVTATMVAGKLIGTAADPLHPVEFRRQAQTDDRGVYRIAGLPPGTYKVSLQITEAFFSVKLVNGSVIMNAARPGIAGLQTWAPDVLSDSDARLVKVTEGAETDGIDLAVPTRKVHSISGMVTQGGVPLSGASVQIVPSGKKPGTKDASAFRSDALTLKDGSYRFDLLPQGPYIVRATIYSQPATGGLSVIGEAKPPQTSEVKPLQRGEAAVTLGETDLEDVDIDLPAAAASRK